MLVLLAKMLHILVLCPVLLIGGVQTLTIDSQLGTSVEDCFERISIGEQLPSSAIYRNVSELTTRECEQICKQDKQCQAYDYGVGAKGNATCDLSTHSEKEVKEKSLLTRHPDYDVYVRRFQCEQTPPKPIQPLLDEPGDETVSNDKPFHRPVFRPDVDDRPLTGDYLVSGDIDPYYLGSKPQSYRPDDISQKPAYDVGPSYGDFKPQEIPYPNRPHRPERPQDPYRPERPDPYRPERPDPYRPSDPYRPERPGPYRPSDPYMPERPDPYRPIQDSYKPDRPEPYKPQIEHKPKPDSNDVLNFENYGKPRPGYPLSPESLRPEKPNYNYIVRPNRRPKPDDEYTKPTRPVEPSNDQYSQNLGPIGPPYNPQRPEKPAYNYNNQYASSYGQNYQNDNSVYVEIYDPPRPYIPIKDRPVQHDYDQGFLGYGTYSSQNSYTQNSGSYTGSITELGYDHNKPDVRPQKPYGQHEEKPGYGNKPSNEPHKGSSQGYGHDYFSLNGHGSYGFDGNKRPGNDLQNSHKRPNDKYKPQNQNSYGGNQNSYGGNHESYGGNQGSYGLIHSQGQSNYGLYGGSNSPSYNQDNGETGYQKPQKPLNNKPSYNKDKGDNGNQGSYGGNHGSYGTNQGLYGNPGYHNSNEGAQDPYGSSQASDGQGSYGSQDYGSQSFINQGSYGSSQTHGGSYGGNKGSYSSNQGSYGSNQGIYGSNQGSYGSNNAYGSQGGYGNRPVFDYEIHKPGYGNEKPYDTLKPGYGSQTPDYKPPTPEYGGQPPGYDTPKPEYGSQKPGYDTPNPGYGSQKPDYEPPTPGYGGQTPGYETPKPEHGSQRPDNHPPRPSYGSQKPDYDPPKPGYGSQTTGYDTPKPGYGNDRPDPGYTKPDNQPGYGDEKPNYTGYGSNSNRPNVKPVYEYEIEKPTNVPTYLTRPGGEVVTSQPVVIGDYERPGYKEPGMSYAACFRRVLAGRRALRSFVRKVVPCERIEDCRQECALEKRFHCESFNYRLDQSFRGKGLCELMTKPIEAFDQQRDFVDDKNYDFYEVDRNSLEPNCPETLRGPGLLHSGFLSSKPGLGDRRMDRPNRVDQRPNRVDQRPNRVDQSGWRDRHGWAGFDRFSYDDRRLYDDRRQGNRGYGEHYVPYQIGQARTEEDNSDWGQYGGNYGGQYYKDRNDYHKSISHWGLSHRPTDFRKSHSFDYHSLGKNLDFGLTRNDFNDIHIEDKGSRYGYGSWKRGRWNNSGVTNVGLEGFFEGRGESHEDSGSHENNDCFSKRRPGMSLKSGAIRRSLIAQSVVECEASCFGEREFKCVSYSYRYSTSRGTDNCFLSERPYRGLEMSADSGSDVYAMPPDKGCSVPSSKPWVESECFWHVRSDTSISGGAVKATLTVAGLGACEAECIRAQGFFCRGFSFRFDAPTIGDEDIHNCILTGSPTTRLSGADSHGHELYARGNYGRGCEPAVYDDSQNTDCYLQYDKAAKLAGPAIRGQARVKDEQTCGTACTEAPFRCLSFSYNNNSPPPADNCFLSEVRQWDLRRGVDYIHSEDDWLFAFDLFNSRCWRHVHNEEHSSELPHPIQIPEDHFHESGPSGPSGPPSGPGYPPDSPPEIPYIPESGPPSGPTGPTGPYKPYPDPYPSYEASGPSTPEKTYPIESYKPLGPINFLPSKPDRFKPGFKPDFRPPEISYKPQYPDPEPFIRPGTYKPELPSFRPDRPFRPTEYPPSFQSGFRPGLKPGDRPGYLPEGRPNQRPQKPGFQGDRDNGPIEASWRHYTVSGFPCRTGTTCAQNKIVGYWACEPEGGEIGSWDYCCAPTHRCGYSEGFNKPWCYVGDTKDQWRPCSEKYYPYHHHNVPHPSQGQRDPPKSRPWRDTPNTPNSPWPVKAPPPPSDYIPHWDKPPGPYLSESDRKYWDDLYRDGPKAYYDKYGNPLPGYSRVPTENRPYIRYKHNNGPPTSGQWVPVTDDLPPVSGLGAARYWPVAYLHRGPPPNITYFRHHGIKPATDRKYITTPPSNDRPESRDDDDGYSLDDNRSDRGRNNGHSRGNSDENNYNSRRNNDDSDDDRDSRGNNDKSRGNNSNSRGNNDTFRDNNDNNRGSNDNARVNSDGSSDHDDNFGENNNSSKNNDSSRRANDNSRNYNSDRGNDRPRNGNRDEESTRDDKKINDSKSNDIFNINVDRTTSKSITTETPIEKANNSDVELLKPKDIKTMDLIKSIDDKLDDFSKSIEVLDIEDAKVEKLSDLKTLEAEERQIEAIGRLLANRRGSQITLEKRSQKELGTENIAVDKDIVDFNFGNRFKTNERRGVIKRISKDEIERDRVDKSLEVSETTYVRPPRVLSTTENIRKALVNGKIFYDATIRDQRDLFANNTRKPKNLRRNENTPSILNNSNFGKKKVIRTRNTNPVRRVKRVYRKRYNPGEVRRRLLERDRSKNNTDLNKGL